MPVRPEAWAREEMDWKKRKNDVDEGVGEEQQVGDA